MNFRIALMAMLVFPAFLMTSCQAEEPVPINEPDPVDDPNPVVFTNSMNLKVDGVLFNPQTILGQSASGLISLTASKQNNEAVTVYVPTSVTPGTYNFQSAAFGNYRGLYNAGGPIGSNNTFGTEAGSGTVDIEYHNVSLKRIKGTFQFIATPTQGSNGVGEHDITECTFEVEY